MKRIHTIPIETPDKLRYQYQDRVDFYSRNTINFSDIDGVFSFVFYYRGELKYKISNVEYNLMEESKWFKGLTTYIQFVHDSTHPFFNSTAVVIYTDIHTFDILKDYWKEYPRVIFAVTTWQRYQDKPNQVEDSILRCMRYHALKAFPNAWVAIRDADTLFEDELGQNLSKNNSGKLIKPEFTQKIAKWEHTFLTAFLNKEIISQSLCVGTGIRYVKYWHKNIPKPYVIDFQIRDRYFFHIAPNDSNQGLEFYAKHGVYAGFFTAKKERESTIWDNCVRYLVQRYKMVRDSKDYLKLYISNHHSKPAHVGKDERIILFSIIINYLTDCYFYALPLNLNNYKPSDLNIIDTYKALHKNDKQEKAKYNTLQKQIDENKNNYILLSPESIDIVLKSKANEILTNYFKKMKEEYEEWLSKYNSKEEQTKAEYLKEHHQSKFLEHRNTLLFPKNTIELKNAYNVPPVEELVTAPVEHVSKNNSNKQTTPNLTASIEPVSKNNSNKQILPNTNTNTSVKTVEAVKMKKCSKGCAIQGGKHKKYTKKTKRYRAKHTKKQRR